MSDTAWNAIFAFYNIHQHDFTQKPYRLTASDIKRATQGFTATGEREPRILCKQDTRESRPARFKELGLFVLPVKNGEYAIIQGEGYVDIPPIQETVQVYRSQLGFPLETASVGNSEMQHLDFAYASSLVRTFMQDESLVLTIRGRKYTPKLSFYVGNQQFWVESVQTEVDAGYEGRSQIVLVEAKNMSTNNLIIRQLFYPFLQWQSHTRKPIQLLFFEKKAQDYCFWEFYFSQPDHYNSIMLRRSERYQIVQD